MKKLSESSRALSDRILKKVTFEKRFIGYRLSERYGASRMRAGPLPWYTMPEAARVRADSGPCGVPRNSRQSVWWEQEVSRLLIPMP